MRLRFAFFPRGGRTTPEVRGFKEITFGVGSGTAQVNGDSFKLLEAESRKYLGQDFYRAIYRSTRSKLENDYRTRREIRD